MGGGQESRDDDVNRNANGDFRMQCLLQLDTKYTHAYTPLSTGLQRLGNEFRPAIKGPSYLGSLDVIGQLCLVK